MMKIIAALSLAAILAASAVPAIADDFDERFFVGQDGNPSSFEQPFWSLFGNLDGEGLEDFVDEFCDEFDQFCEREFGGDDFEDFSASRFGADDFDANRFDTNRFGANSLDGFDDGGSGIARQEIDQEAESGDVSLSSRVSLSGDNSNQCAPAMQFANTGNNQNAQTLTQYFSATEDFEVEGGSISFEPEFENSCDQSVEQAAAAGRR